MATPRTNGITRDSLREVLGYRPRKGEFFWLICPFRGHVIPGEIAGSIYTNGYRYITIDDVPYRAARLAWLYVYGEPVPSQIDHRNLNKSDDRISNLRAVTSSQNQANRGLMVTNTSGIKGVRWQADRQRWGAAITINGVARNLGRFLTKEDAIAAYDAAATAAWGQFARST